MAELSHEQRVQLEESLKSSTRRLGELIAHGERTPHVLLCNEALMILDRLAYLHPEALVAALGSRQQRNPNSSLKITLD